MFRLIIVDDDEITRNGIATKFNWEAAGFEVYGLFEDGKDAIDFLSKNHVDAVLTDIKMYEVSGIDVARYVFESCPQTIVVILSGYREFDYAQSAIKYGVCDYLLKPADKNKIYEVFTRVRDILAKQKQELSNETLPFNFYNKEKYREITACNSKIISSVVCGDIDSFYSFHEEWFAHIKVVPPELVPNIIAGMFEGLFFRMERLKVQSDIHLEQETVFQKLSNIRKDEIFIETGKILLELCESFSQKKDGEMETIVERAKQYIKKNIAKNITVDEVARSVFLSLSYFSHTFKSVTGMNVVEYIIKSRMDLAIELIKENRLSAGEIGARAGYADPKYFQRSFKKYTGYTVKEFRRISTRD